MEAPTSLLSTPPCRWSRKLQRELVYGSGRSVDAPSISELLLVCLMLGLLWVYPMISAFSCGNSPTSLSLNGTAWGILILFLGPVVGIPYAVLGRCACA